MTTKIKRGDFVFRKTWRGSEVRIVSKVSEQGDFLLIDDYLWTEPHYIIKYCKIAPTAKWTKFAPHTP